MSALNTLAMSLSDLGQADGGLFLLGGIIIVAFLLLLRKVFKFFVKIAVGAVAIVVLAAILIFT